MSKAWTRAWTVAMAGSLAACSSSAKEDEIDESDHRPPIIEVHTPERGTSTTDAEILVTGRAYDNESSITRVTVNGVEATVESDGRFNAALPLAQGIAIIETIATDRGQNQAGDVRAVLAGNLVQHDVPVDDALVAFISSQAMSGLGDLVDTYVSGVDLTALAKSYNPVVDSGDSCNSYKGYVTSVERGDIVVSAEARDGGIHATVSIYSLVIDGYIDWRAFCGNGTSNYTITADAYDATALIVPGLDGTSLTIALEDVTSSFRDFQLDVSGVPGFVEDQFEDKVRDKVAEILRDKINEVTPPLAVSFLNGFLSETHYLDLLGRLVEFRVWPSELSFTDAGGLISLGATSTVEGAGEWMYLATPSPRPTEADMASTGLRIALADDILNQMLSGMWAGGVFEDTMLPGESDALSAAFGAEVAQATLTMMLPPVASFDTDTGTAQIVLGDLVVEVLGPEGEILAEFVVSAEIDLAAESTSDGGIRLVTQTPRVLAQILQQSDSLLTELDTAKVAAIAELGIKQLALKADDLLDNLPVPGLPDSQITSPTLQPANGYLLMGGELSFE